MSHRPLLTTVTESMLDTTTRTTTMSSRALTPRLQAVSAVKMNSCSIKKDTYETNNMKGDI